jgi:hypothetical protein
MRSRDAAVLILLGGWLLACPKEEAVKGTPAPSAAPTVSTSSTAASPPAGEDGMPKASRDRAQEEACVDRWLAQRKLDPYGNEEGMMYAGGTPLFDERTGRTTDRLEYVYRKHPEARAACAPARPPAR